MKFPSDDEVKIVDGLTMFTNAVADSNSTIESLEDLFKLAFMPESFGTLQIALVMARVAFERCEKRKLSLDDTGDNTKIGGETCRT